jgi:hydroxymethylbilane synthase
MSSCPHRPDFPICVAARASRLSRLQLQEVLSELQCHLLQAAFQPLYVTTHGDHDQKRSLRDLDKTDFFTREIDALLLNRVCRAAIHSAKDLPDPLSAGLVVVALTRGVDPADALVLRDGETFEGLPAGAKIATSSLRREEVVRRLRSDLCFVDIRGVIEVRLKQLDDCLVDGVVMAEAALLRLGLERNRLRLPGESAPHQGRLAILARDDDLQMRQLFACIDDR